MVPEGSLGFLATIFFERKQEQQATSGVGQVIKTSFGINFFSAPPSRHVSLQGGKVAIPCLIDVSPVVGGVLLCAESKYFNNLDSSVPREKIPAIFDSIKFPTESWIIFRFVRAGAEEIKIKFGHGKLVPEVIVVSQVPRARARVFDNSERSEELSASVASLYR